MSDYEEMIKKLQKRNNVQFALETVTFEDGGWTDFNGVRAYWFEDREVVFRYLEHGNVWLEHRDEPRTPYMKHLVHSDEMGEIRQGTLNEYFEWFFARNAGFESGDNWNDFVPDL